MKTISALVSRRLRCLLAVAVLVVPIALVAPGYIRGEVDKAKGARSAFAPLPFGVPPGQYNRRLAIGVVKHVAPDASLAVVGRRLATDGMRWFAYVIAPRLLTDARDARWTLVFGETPQHAHLDPVRSWRYGADWLVER